MTARAARSMRNVAKRKRKAKRAIPRTTAVANAGNTVAARTRAKKLAGKRRAAKAKAAAAAPAG